MTHTHTDQVGVLNVGSKSMLDSGLQRKIRDLILEGANRVLLDLADLADIDSSGMGELVLAHISMAHAGGSMALIHVNHRVKEQLRFAGLEAVLTVQEEESSRARSEVYVG